MMKRVLIFLFFFVLAASPCHAGFLDDITKKIKKFVPDKSSENTTDNIIAGLKEALTVGAEKTVSIVSKTNGYFNNEKIRIPMPDKIRTVTDTLKKFGFHKPVDDFELSMNQAAEKAAPKAKTIFIDAIKKMSIEDAKKILDGTDTAATDYLKSKTFDNLYSEFKPSVSSSMDEVGVTRYYKAMMDKFNSLPFVKKQSMDVDHYVTNKSLDGLFYMIGQEEKDIRENPAARVTDLLKDVFGKKQ